MNGTDELLTPWPGRLLVVVALANTGLLMMAPVAGWVASSGVPTLAC